MSWMRWVLDSYPGNQIYLLVDETKICDRIGCMMISLPIQKRAIPLIQLAHCGQTWHGAGTLFTRHRTVDCEVHILWEAEHAEPWCLATNLPGLTGPEYAFRDLKSAGWQ